MVDVSHPAISDLIRIRRLSQFNDAQLETLATRLTVESGAKGGCLIECGCSENFSLYLLTGAVTATDQNDNETSFVSSAEGEIFPIAQIRPSMYRIVASEPVQFIKIHAALLTEFAQSLDTDKTEVQLIEIEQSAEENLLAVKLFEDLLSDNLNLPSLPKVAQQIQEVFADETVNASDVCTVIHSDPVIAAKIIMIANSALYGGLAPVETLQQAVVRLGLETTRTQVMTFAVKDLFDGRSPEIVMRMQNLWKHSRLVACLCRLMADHLPGFDADQAQLAGLVHDLGEVAILQYAQQDPEILENTDLLMRVVKTLRSQVTGMLLSQWKFDTEFVTVGEECEDWFRNPSDQADLCDLVLIAQYHALIGSAEMKQLPPVKTLPAFAKLGMENLEVTQIVEFLKSSRTEIDAIESRLGFV